MNMLSRRTAIISSVLSIIPFINKSSIADNKKLITDLGYVSDSLNTQSTFGQKRVVDTAKSTLEHIDKMKFINEHDLWVYDLGVSAAENFRKDHGVYPCKCNDINNIISKTESEVKKNLIEAGVLPEHISREFAVRTYAFLEVGRE